MPDVPTSTLNLSATGDLTVRGDVVGRDKIIQNITQIYERAKTAIEEAEHAQAAEGKILAEGVLAVAQRLHTRASDTSNISGTNPYKGLLEYRLSDAEFFFGRERAIRELLAQLERGSLTVLHSESGAGKTSLLQAGLAPRLLAHEHLPLYLRPYNIEPQYAIKRAFISDLSRTPDLSTAPLRDFLRRVTSVLGESRHLFICLDQFEEFFTQLAAPEREEFVKELAECLDDSSLNVRWVLALRTEYFGNLANFRPRIQNPFENDFRLNRLTRDEARQVIVAPAERVGLRYEDGLVDAILDDLGQKEIAPPQMQLVCSALFEELEPEQKIITQEVYEREGRAAGILRGHLERVLSRDLPGPQRAAARRLLESLISSEQQRVVRTHTELVAELSAKGVTAQTLDVILGQLVNSRLLRPHESEAGEVSYELSHDYLLGEISLDPDVQARKAAQELLEQEVRAFRRYQTLLTPDRLNVIEPYASALTLTDEAKQLLAASRETIEKEKRAEDARRVKELEDAHKLAESEKQRAEEREQAAQRLQTRNRLVTGVGVVAGVLAIVAFVLFGQANTAREEADQQRNLAQTQEAIAVTAQARAEDAAARAAAETLRAEAEARQARIGLAGQFAAQSQTALKDIQPQAAILLAMEALNVTRQAGEPDVALAQSALQSALYSMDNVGLGQRSFLSPDGRWLAVRADDGQQLQLFITEGDTPTTPVTTLTLADNESIGESFGFTPDNVWFLSEVETDTERQVRGWPLDTDDFSNYADFGVISETTAVRDFFVVSPDSQWVLVRSNPPTLFDLTLADPTASPFPLREATANGSYRFTANSQWLIATQTEYDFTQTSAVLQAWALNAPDPTVPRINHEQPQTENGYIALSRDARTLAFAFDDVTTGKVPLQTYDLTAINPRQAVISEDLGPIIALTSAGRWLITLASDYSHLKLLDLSAPDAPPLELRGLQFVDSVSNWRLSPDERWLVTHFTRETGVGSETAMANVWDLSLDNPLAEPALTFTGAEARAVSLSPQTGGLLTPGPLPSYNFDFSPDARYLIVTEDNAFAYVFDLRAEQPFTRAVPLVAPSSFEQKLVLALEGSFTFSPDGRWLALGFGNPSQLWDLSKLSQAPLFLEPSSLEGSPIRFSPDSQWLILLNDETPWLLYDLQNQAQIPIEGHDWPLTEVRFTFGSRALISVDAVGYTRWLELADAPIGHRSTALSRDRSRLVTVRGARAFLWEVSQPVLPLPLIFEHTRTLMDATLSPDNRWLATYAADEQLRLWDLTAPRPAAAPLFALPVPIESEFSLLTLTFSADGQWLMLSTLEGTQLWRVSQFEAERAANLQPAINLPSEFMPSLLSPNGQWLFGSLNENDTFAQVAYDLSQPTVTPVPLNTEMNLSAISPDSRWLAFADFFASPGLQVWEVAALPSNQPVIADKLFIQDGGFSRDGQWLAFYGSDDENGNVAYVYRLGERPQRYATLTSDDPMLGQAFTPDGTRYLRLFAGEALITPLDASEAEPQSLQGFTLSSLVFPIIYQSDISADSQWFALNDYVGLRLWNLAAPDQPEVLLGPAPTLTGLKFGADRYWLILEDGQNVRLVGLDVEALLARACRAAGRNLSREEWARFAPGQPYRATCAEWPSLP